MDREHTLYLTSSDSLDVFPNNTPFKFVNRLASPITLDPNYDYEIGLVSILYPNEYYAIIGNEYKNNLTFYTKMYDVPELQKYSYIVQDNIPAGNPEKLVHMLNKEITARLKVYYQSNYSKIFPSGKIFFWDDYEKKVGIHYTAISEDKLNNLRKGDIEKVKLHMEHGMANILGFHSSTLYTILGEDQQLKSSISITTIDQKFGIDFMYVYTDIIQPTNFGSQLVNILDCFTLDKGGNKGIHNTLYKPLKNSYIDQISIIISDQNGKPIYFKHDSTVTCVLHIRPK